MSKGKKLSRALQNLGRAWVEEHGRPLEKARLAVLRGEGSAQGVLEALAPYQNPDGGFGNALEPDLRSPSSSPMATAVAFQNLRRIQAPGDLAMVQEALRYLQQSFVHETFSWPQTSLDAEAFPHAFWWKGSASPESGRVNPGAELLGALLDYRDQLPAEFLKRVTSSVSAALLEDPDSELEMHTLLSLGRLLETEDLPSALEEGLGSRFLQAARKGVLTDPESWSGYGLPPTALIRSPNHRLFPLFEEAVEAHLDVLVEGVQEDGTWPVPWSWEELNPEAWKLARQEWTGVLLVEKLELFRAFQRLE